MRQTQVIVALCAAVLLSACSESGVSGVNTLLNTRDASINNRDITTYSELIADDYQGRQLGKADIIKEMQLMFDQFTRIEMESFGRDVYMVDDTHARAAQSYRMKVSMDGSKREMLQREELSLIHTDSGWKISSGL